MNETPALLENNGVLHPGIGRLLKTASTPQNARSTLGCVELREREITALDDCHLVTCLAPADLCKPPGVYTLAKIGSEYRLISAASDDQNFPEWKAGIPQSTHGVSSEVVQQIFTQRSLLVSLTQHAKTFAAMDKLDVPWTIHYIGRKEPIVCIAEVDQIHVRVILPSYVPLTP